MDDARPHALLVGHGPGVGDSIYRFALLFKTCDLVALEDVRQADQARGQGRREKNSA